MERFTRVLITGASSGIGRALAEALARPDAVLHLGGRDPGRLREAADACRGRGAEVHEALIDVRDAPAMAGWIGGAGRLDLVIANAGMSAGAEGGAAEPAAQARAIFATNLDGMLNTALPAIEALAAQAPDAKGVRGHLAVVASIGAFVPAPGAPAYCAAKAAVDAWTIGNRQAARRRGVKLTSICPGYVRTPMTAANRFPMPGLMDAERAAGLILRGLAAGRARIAFPWWLYAAARLAALLPPGLLTALLATAPGKAAAPQH